MGKSVPGVGQDRRLMPPGMDIQTVTDTTALERLAPEWQELSKRCPASTVFQSPEWLIPWWKYFGRNNLFTLVMRSHGRMVGLAPFFIYQNRRDAAREVLLLGTGITDVLDVLIEPGFEATGAAMFLEHLSKSQRNWDVCDFQQLSGDSPLLRAPTPPSLGADIIQQDPCLRLMLPAKLDELQHCSAASMLEKSNQDRRRAEKSGELRLETAEVGTFGGFFDTFTKLHRARWACRAEQGVLATPAIVEFHRQAACCLLGEGALRLYMMFLADRPIAALYGFADARRVYYYLSGFDPQFRRFSPGRILIAHVITESVRSHAMEFNFLRGREPYKYLWGAEDCPMYRRRLRPASVGRDLKGQYFEKHSIDPFSA